MPTSKLDLVTPHGTCPTQIFTPDGAGPWPAVIVCFDAFGVRPSLAELSARIARGGYVVALPDFYYRVGSPFSLKPDAPKDDARALFPIFGDEKLRTEFMTRFMVPTLAYDHLKDTVSPLLDALKKHSSVKGGVGTTGYCMGGTSRCVSRRSSATASRRRPRSTAASWSRLSPTARTFVSTA